MITTVKVVLKCRQLNGPTKKEQQRGRALTLQDRSRAKLARIAPGYLGRKAVGKRQDAPGLLADDDVSRGSHDWQNIASLTMSAVSSTKLRTLLLALVKERHFALDENGRDTGTQDRQHYSDSVEERSKFRPQTVAAANILSISGEYGFPSLGFSLCWW